MYCIVLLLPCLLHLFLIFKIYSAIQPQVCNKLSVSKSFQIHGPTTGKAQLATVETRCSRLTFFDSIIAGQQVGGRCLLVLRRELGRWTRRTCSTAEWLTCRVVHKWSLRHLRRWCYLPWHRRHRRHAKLQYGRCSRCHRPACIYIRQHRRLHVNCHRCRRQPCHRRLCRQFCQCLLSMRSRQMYTATTPSTLLQVLCCYPIS